MVIEELPDQQIYFELICQRANNINETDNTTIFIFENDYYCIWTIPDPIMKFKNPIEFILARKLEVSPCIQLKKLSPQIILDAINELAIREVHETDNFVIEL
jgi:hypothetical protein